MKSCLLCGVGGQGTVLASRILADAAMEKGCFARTAETIGMAQRGGSVVSHVRFGNVVPSSMIPFGKADVIIGFEPGEVVRNLAYLKEDGIVIVCKREVQPITATISGNSYSGEQMLDYIKSKVEKCYIIDGDKISAECGSTKVLNVAVVGAVTKSGALDISLEDVEKILKTRLKPQFLEMNRKALKLGAECIA